MENTGTEDLACCEMFKAPIDPDVWLDDWIAALPPELVRRHLGLSDVAPSAIPKDDLDIVPAGKA